MTLALVAPGQRKGNRYWLVYGRYDGRVREVSTKTTEHAAAKRFLREYERELAKGADDAPPKPGDVVTFSEAARLYAEWRGLDLCNPMAQRGQARVEVRAINRLVAELGRRPIAGMGQLDLVAAANLLLPDAVNATRNRWVIKPASAILHYAARAKLCAWERIEKFAEPPPETRAVTRGTAASLIEAADGLKKNRGPKQLLLVWLFCQGSRISNTLAVRWEDLDLERQTVRMRPVKGHGWREFPLQDELVERLAAIPLADRVGRLFPWASTSGVYKWLRPLTAGLGVKFTPHMGRHSKGAWLNESGAGLSTIMATLGHADAASSIRYQSVDLEVVRAANRRLGKIGAGRVA